MANKNCYKCVIFFRNRKSMNGKPLNKNEVLVPFWIQKGSKFQKNEIIAENCIAFHLAGYVFTICFIPIDVGNYADYMHFFWNEINEYLKIRHSDKFRCLSLDQLMEDSHFNVEDTHTVNPEDIFFGQME
jgi:hypothetical protein